MKQKIEFHKAECYMEFTGKADEFWLDVERQQDIITRYPEAFQVRYKNIRIVVLERLNYVKKTYRILLYRFFNQKQNF